MYLSARMEIHRLLGVPIGQGRVQKAALYCMWLVEGLPPSDGDQGSPPHCSELHIPQCSGCALVFWSSLCLTRCEVNQAVVLSLVFLKGLRHKGEQCSSFCCWGLVAVGCRSSLPPFLSSVGWFNRGETSSCKTSTVDSTEPFCTNKMTSWMTENLHIHIILRAFLVLISSYLDS